MVSKDYGFTAMIVLVILYAIWAFGFMSNYHQAMEDCQIKFSKDTCISILRD